VFTIINMFMYILSKMSDPPKIMVFRFTIKEFINFPSYIQFMELNSAHHAGLGNVRNFITLQFFIPF
jgi:hypothetical protein